MEGKAEEGRGNPLLHLWRSPWSRRKGWAGTRLHFEVLFVGVLLVVAPYFITNNIAHMYLETAFDPELALDRRIPVIYWMILPYTLLYLLYPLTLVICPRDDRGRAELATAMHYLILVNTICCGIFLVLPAEIDMREQIDWDRMNAWQSALFELVHSADNPWNAWPSLHIVHSYFLTRLMTFWLLREYPGKMPHRAFIVLLWVEWTLLCLSIMTTKQHYLFDLVTGIAMGHLAWHLCSPNLARIASKGPDEFASFAGWSD